MFALTHGSRPQSRELMEENDNTGRAHGARQAEPAQDEWLHSPGGREGGRRGEEVVLSGEPG